MGYQVFSYFSFVVLSMLTCCFQHCSFVVNLLTLNTTVRNKLKYRFFVVVKCCTVILNPLCYVSKLKKLSALLTESTQCNIRCQQDILLGCIIFYFYVLFILFYIEKCQVWLKCSGTIVLVVQKTVFQKQRCCRHVLCYYDN